MLSVLVASLAFTSEQRGCVSARRCSRCSAGPAWRRHTLEGFWGFHESAAAYRIPVLVAFAVLVRRAGAVAGTQEPGHAAELLGRRDAGHAVLACARRRAVHGLVLCRCCC